MLWHSIKNITNSHKTKPPNQELLSIEGTPVDSANLVNGFFASVGANLAGRILPTSLTSDRGTEGASAESFVLLETDCDEVRNAINNLKSSSSTGYDGISSQLLKLIQEFIVPPLTDLFNDCLNLGVFPEFLSNL
ncbi:uncharacterized protein LOC113495141 [Trichoplusia ni]|uniref:Uncharacterized protein LOC113495141 n=1 Tax=Trichoplusia ni TaxID=7111 RepID=A0A7E5VMP1_TRINI|nr:uncharacterized protein LOC113495141 [Trichoplusia ni]